MPLLKHAPNVWGSAKALIEAFHEAGVPADAFVGLYTDNETAEALIGHSLVRAVNFTGSYTVGATVASAAGRHRKKTVLELGSNDAYLVLSDADIDLVVASIEAGATLTLGGGIFSTDVDRAVQLAREEFDTGSININGFQGASAHLPFGGVKDSGYGGEHGNHGIMEFVNTKTVKIADIQG